MNRRRRLRKQFELDPAYLGSLTPLERFLRTNGIRPAYLAAISGYSRQHLLRIRAGRMEPSRRCIAAVLAAARLLSRRRNLTVLDLFQFEDGPVERDGRKNRRVWEAIREALSDKSL